MTRRTTAPAVSPHAPVEALAALTLLVACLLMVGGICESRSFTRV